MSYRNIVQLLAWLNPILHSLLLQIFGNISPVLSKLSNKVKVEIIVLEVNLPVIKTIAAYLEVSSYFLLWCQFQVYEKQLYNTCNVFTAG